MSMNDGRKKHRSFERCFSVTQVCKPGSVLTAIYLAPRLLTGSSRLLGTVGQTICPSTALLRDRVYIVKPMLPWAGCALTAPFHPYLVDSPAHSRKRKRSPGAPFMGYEAVSLCCTCPGVTPGGRYPLSLPCGARTFLIWCLSASIRGCPTWLLEYCTLIRQKSQMSCKFFSERIYCLRYEI